jgi:HTH-type transcriptional regulator, sugar sensing transcriptional regulator
MDDKLLSVLEEIGLSKNEASIYLALLDLGSATATKIAERSKLHRTNVYDSLERLVKKGLVSYISKGETKYFTAAEPENFVGLLKQKEQNLADILPQLKLSRKLAEKKDSAHVYEGMAGIRAITEDILATIPEKGEVLTFGNPKNVSDLMKSFIDLYHKRRMEKKITQIHIYNENSKDRIKLLNAMPYTKAGYLPKEYDSPSSTTIYGNKVAFFIWSEPPLGIVIESERMAESYRKYFQLLWRLSEK